jgi:Tartrate dehydratase beta subunit/Fumarate hydratase class I, C-terminal domain
MPKTVHLQTPLAEKDIKNLQLDDVVYLSGDAYSMLYIDHYTLIMDILKKGDPLPMELRDRVIYNTGVIYRKETDGSYDIRALGTTTSSKYNAYTPEFIKLTGIRAVLGKGGMDAATLAAMKEHGCVYLALAGGCSAIYTPMVGIVEEYWPELTPIDNQRLRLRLKEFGPLFVAMDANGNSIFEECAETARNTLPAMYRALGISAG